MSKFDFTKSDGMGTDTIDRSVLGPPFINIIQKGSPEFDETHRKFSEKKIKDCRPGNILFEPERLILPQPVQVIPLAQTTLYTEWRPNKGGFVGNRSLDITQDRRYRKGDQNNPKTKFREYLGDNELVYTITFAVLFQHGTEWKKGLIAFTATQLKHARNWSRSILGLVLPDSPGIKAPIFAAKWDLSTAAESNTEGGWFGWSIANARLLSPEADQALLEQAFEATKAAQLSLPQPQAQGALAAPAEVAVENEPY